jgi:uncharacterized phage-associated protein
MGALDVAYYLIKKAREQKQSGTSGETVKITPLKLQKLLYFAQGIYLKTNDDPLFEDPIEAWDLGPVVPTLYRFFKAKGFGEENLVDAINEQELEDKASEVGEKYKPFLDKFFDVYLKHSSTILVNASHNHTIWQKAHRSFDKRMPVEQIKDYFRSL